MADYERSETVQASAEEVFAYLSDVGNLPGYMERMTSAERTGPEEVRTTARIDLGDGEGPRDVEGEAWLRVDEAEQRMEWGSEGPNDYRGELDVTPAADGSSTVAIRLHTERTDGPGIERDLQSTVESLKAQVEARVAG